MKRSIPLTMGLLAALLVIAFKLTIILGGFALSNFGFKWSQFISVLIVIPFIPLAIRQERTQRGGFIGGKVALQQGLKTAVIAILLISIYHYIEFEWKWKEIAYEYYHGDAFLDFLKSNDKMKEEDYNRYIDQSIEMFTNSSPFQFVTIKMVPYLFFSISAAFICAVFMKKSPPPSYTNN